MAIENQVNYWVHQLKQAKLRKAVAEKEIEIANIHLDLLKEEDNKNK